MKLAELEAVNPAPFVILSQNICCIRKTASIRHVIEEKQTCKLTRCLLVWLLSTWTGDAEVFLLFSVSKNRVLCEDY